MWPHNNFYLNKRKAHALKHSCLSNLKIINQTLLSTVERGNFVPALRKFFEGSEGLTGPQDRPAKNAGPYSGTKVPTSNM